VVIDELVGESELMREVLKNIAIAATTDVSILITVDPGTGKELVARGIHKAGSRAENPFVAVNCAAINPNLISSPNYSDTRKRRSPEPSLANKADLSEQTAGHCFSMRSVICPPEPGNAFARPAGARIRASGRTQAIKLDIRLITASNHDLAIEVEEGSFAATCMIACVDILFRRHLSENVPQTSPFLSNIIPLRLNLRPSASPNCARGEMMKEYIWRGVMAIL
jgi:transcriptional regulator with AAA-type ATPase domain